MSDNSGPTNGIRQFVFRTSTLSKEKMRKESTVDVMLGGQVMLSYDIACDESELLGGDDSAPPPLAFFTSAIDFCIMTQISRYAHMRKLKISDVRMTTTVHYRNEGSVLQGTVQGFIDKVESIIEVDSDESDETIEKLIQDAERGCYVQYALTHPIEVQNKLIHNGG